MTRRVGVLVALVALVATASADKGKQAAPAKKSAVTAKPAAEPAAEQPAADAAGAEAGSAEPTPAEIEASLPPHITGPKLVDLGNNMEVDLPAGMILFEKVEAKKFLEQSGDQAENVNAVIGKIGADWLVVVEYEDVGYVSDSDANELDEKELLASYQEGTKQQNERRKTMGVPELFIDGWSEKPKYDKTVHHLRWGLNAHSTSGPVINYFERVLGRHGYMSIDLIDAPDKMAATKVETAPLLAATRFKAGFTYADHKSDDKSSGIGLRALVLGGTGLAVLKVAKAGFFIKLLLIFKKGIIVLVAAIGGFFKWLMGRGKKSEPVADLPPSDGSTQG